MNNKKSIRNIIIACVVLIIALVIIMSIVKNDNNNTEIQEDRQIFPENIVIKDRYEYNEFQYSSISTEQLLLIYLNKYRNDCLYDTEAAFNSLDEEYKEKRFGTYDAYVEYLNAERDNIMDAKIQTFSTYEYDNGKEYIIKDQFGRIYVFEVAAVMEYKVMLDTYTVPTQSFIAEYEKVDDEKKAALNLNKFLEAIKNQDYKYAYSKLYTTFRNNNFVTQLDFENYINQNWLNYDNIETVNVENQAGVYTCKLSIIDENGVETERTFMMQLVGEADYQVSFTI